MTLTLQIILSLILPGSFYFALMSIEKNRFIYFSELVCFALNLLTYHLLRLLVFKLIQAHS